VANEKTYLEDRIIRMINFMQSIIIFKYHIKAHYGAIKSRLKNIHKLHNNLQIYETINDNFYTKTHQILFYGNNLCLLKGATTYIHFTYTCIPYYYCP